MTVKILKDARDVYPNCQDEFEMCACRVTIFWMNVENCELQKNPIRKIVINYYK